MLCVCVAFVLSLSGGFAFAQEVEQGIDAADAATGVAALPVQEGQEDVAPVPQEQSEQTDSLTAEDPAGLQEDGLPVEGEPAEGGLEQAKPAGEQDVADGASSAPESAPLQEEASVEQPVQGTLVSFAETQAVNGWVREDGNWRYYVSGKAKTSGWLVTGYLPGAAKDTGLQRYYFDASGNLMMNTTFQATQSGVESWFRATEAGYVARGKVTDSKTGYVYLADNNGRLEKTGWCVTLAYGDGLQRYWVDENAHACVPGVSTDGYPHRTLKAGYVARGAVVWGDVWMWADDDGRLAGDRWLVTDAFGQGLQRYWAQADYCLALSRVVAKAEAGYTAYATANHYVARSQAVADPKTGYVYLVDNDGRAYDRPGWLVSSAYGQGLQRYWVDGDKAACVPGAFMADSWLYYTLPGKGYVLRGSKTIDGQTVVADNDGMIILNFGASFGTSGAKNKAQTNSSYLSGLTYLFLPAASDLTSLNLTYSLLGLQGSLWILNEKTGSYQEYTKDQALNLNALGIPKNSNGCYIVRYKLDSKSKKTKVFAVMQSAYIASMFIASDDPASKGRAYVESSPDHSAKATGSLVMYSGDGTLVYDGGLSQIRGRGNTTWEKSKKPYQIKLEAKTDLLETGDKANKAKTWELLSSAKDVTLLRNKIALDLAQGMGMTSSPESRFVDLYYDGEYRGTYELTEKVQLGSGRVSIDELEKRIEDANAGTDLDSLSTGYATNGYGYGFTYVKGVKDTGYDFTSGYLLEIDEWYHEEERCWFETSAGYFVVKEPGNLSYNQMRYISEFVCRAMDAALSNSGYCSYTGLDLHNYIDVTSFAQLLLVNEASGNWDFMHSSTYFYLPSEDDGLRHVLYAGPAWDFDIGFGSLDSDSSFASRLYSSGAGLLGDKAKPFTSNGAEWDAIKKLYPKLDALLTALIDGKVDPSGCVKSLSAYVALISPSQKMNQVVWGLTLEDEPDIRYYTDSYQHNIDLLRSWLVQRRAWLRSYFSYQP